MKIWISNSHHFDTDAPTVVCELVKAGGVDQWQFLCDHCGEYHYHGAAPGHRYAHCSNQESPYQATGYNLTVKPDGILPSVSRTILAEIESLGYTIAVTEEGGMVTMTATDGEGNRAAVRGPVVETYRLAVELTVAVGIDVEDG